MLTLSMHSTTSTTSASIPTKPIGTQKTERLQTLLLEGRFGSLDEAKLKWIQRLLGRWIESLPLPRIEIDLEEVTHFGSGLVNILLKANELARAKGGSICVRGDQTGVLKMLKLDAVFCGK